MNNSNDPKDGGASLPGGVPNGDATPPRSQNSKGGDSGSANVPDGGVSQKKEEPKPIQIVLTFDDGPHTAGKDTKNYTREIATVLKNRKIVGAFFIQANAKDRFREKVGKDVTKEVSELGHVIAIHTGSKEDHTSHSVRVAKPAYDVDGDSKPDGLNALESDLISAKSEIQKVLGTAPRFVRAVGLENLTDKMRDTYNRVGLKHIGVNVDSKDNTKPDKKKHAPAPVVMQTLESGDWSVPNAIKNKRAQHLIVLFHDINGTTAASLGTYIDTIKQAVEASDRKAEFTSSTKAVIDIFDATRY